MKRFCEHCGAEYEVIKGNQRYCTVKCRRAAAQSAICNVTDCRFYSEYENNHCGILNAVVIPCNFYKPGVRT